MAEGPYDRARKRHINFEHIDFLKVGRTLGQPAGRPEGKIYISFVSRRTHELFGPVNPGTTSRLSQGHLDVNQSKKLCSCAFFSPGYEALFYLCKVTRSTAMKSCGHLQNKIQFDLPCVCHAHLIYFYLFMWLILLGRLTARVSAWA